MESADNKKYIPNTYLTTDYKQVNLEDLKFQLLKILEQDFKTFMSSIRPEETTAFASIQRKNRPDFSSFDGAGSYLTLYITLIQFLRAINSSKETSSIKQFLAKIEGFNETSLIERAKKSYKALLPLLFQAEEDTSQMVQISYYFGGAGLFLNGLILGYYQRDPKMFRDNLKEILSYKQIIYKELDCCQKELLYGVTGYLYCLLKIQELCAQEKIGSDFHVENILQGDIRKLMTILIDEGINNYNPHINFARLPNDFRLRYFFYKSEYFGAAHGLFGVLYILIKAYQMNQKYLAKEDQVLVLRFQATVKASLEYLLQFQEKSGGFPISPKFSDGSVQFCHGSPGAVQCLMLASEVFKGFLLAENCLKAALLAGEDIWKYGILKKGFGLCHGVSGNAYSFLNLFRSTKDKKWLYRAYVFLGLKEESKGYIEIMKEFDFEGRYVKGISDFPFSLMMGLAGDICCEVEALCPEIARFPGYEI